MVTFLATFSVLRNKRYVQSRFIAVIAMQFSETCDQHQLCRIYAGADTGGG